MAKSAVSKKPAPVKAGKPARKPNATEVARAPVFTVGLNQLRYGHDKGAPVEGLNSRVTDRKGALQELVASIRAVGLVAPLAVAEGAGGFWYVIDGNRRLAALRQVAKADKLADDHQVPVRKVDASLFEASLAANVVRAPMHPVDQFEAFAKLNADGMTVGDIAARFGLTDRTVRQRLALGQLHPTVRAAWRAEEIDAETAKAFTLTSDQDRQAEVFKEAHESDQLDPHFVESKLVGDITQDNRFVRFVGLEAYRAAGGEVVADLFEEEVHVLNPDVLDRLVREKMKAVCDELVAAGWAWAKYRADVDPSKFDRPYRDDFAALTEDERARYQAIGGGGSDWQQGQRERLRLRRLGRERSFSDSERAELGCLVNVDPHGDLELDHGYSDGKRAKAKAEFGGDDDAAAARPAAEPEQKISHVLAQSLSVQFTQAIRTTLSADAALAFQVAVATLLQSGRGPARLSAITDGKSGRISRTFASALRYVQDLPAAEVDQIFAEMVADAIDVNVERCLRDMVQPADTAALVAALDQEQLQAEALHVFDLDEYFIKAPAKAAIAALIDIDGRNSCISSKKADIAALASGKAQKAGWLPPELRGPGYSGPGSKPAVAEAAE